MKAIIISSLLFFSLRAMSATIGQDQKGDCVGSPAQARESVLLKNMSFEALTADEKPKAEIKKDSSK